MRRDRRGPYRPRHARGSAYVVVLLTLVVLTILGLALSLITQSEMQIGANERTIQKVFYAAESGIHLAVAKGLVIGDHRAMRLDFREPATLDDLNIAHRLEVSPFFPILSSPCDLCQINQGDAFYEVNHAVTSSASRIGWTGNGPPPESPTTLARELVSVMVEIQPWTPSAEAVAGATPEQLQQIHF